MKKENHSLDALILTGIRFMTLLINILSTAILSKVLSLEEFGTYTTGNLIVTTAANITILGMMDAANYFYHQSDLNRRDCINTIAFLQILLGIACAAVIVLSGSSITAYFGNPMLGGIYAYIALRPLLENLSNSLLSLQMAIRKARAVGIQNALFAIGKLAAILFTVTVTKDIRTVFGAYLLLDLGTVFYYYWNFKKAEFAIDPRACRKELITPVLRFAVPMGLYVMVNGLNRDLDKLVIGRFESTSLLAIYSNCAAPLPLGIVSAAFLTVIVPTMTKLIQNDALERARRLFRDYLSIGFISTAILATACMILSEETILLLYGEKYLPGKTVFLLYILVDLIKFANTSLVLSAKGRTKTLMSISFLMLLVNGVLNLLLHLLFGMIGPAIATVAVSFAMTLVLLAFSGRILHAGFFDLVDWPVIGKTAISLVAVGACADGLRAWLRGNDIPYFLRLCIVGGSLCLALLLINWKRIRQLLHAVNHECKEK